MTEESNILGLEIERRKQFEPLRFFKPNAAQERFINAVADPNTRIILFSAGNWLGKSAAAIVVLGAMIWPEQAEHECFNNPMFKKWPFPKMARIVSTPKELEIIGSMQTEIKKWWPTGKYKGDKMGHNYPCQFSAKDWLVDLLTYDMSPDQFEGATRAITIYNEPPPEQLFNAGLARMKFGGKILMPLTPLTNSAWIYDRLVGHDGENGIKVVYGDTEDNCKEHSKNGVLPHEAIQQLSDSCDPDDREARLHGKFMHLQGQIFKTFNRDIHVIKDQPLDQFLSGSQIYHINDPAIGKPLALLWANVTATGIITIFNEWPKFEFQGAKDSNMTVEAYATLIKAEEGHYRAIDRILDKRFGNQQRMPGGPTLKQEFAEHGIDYRDSYSVSDSGPEVETGILKVKDLLRYNKEKPIDNLNRPRLQIFESCKNTIHALERWSRDPKTGKPKEEFKDFADCIRYLAMCEPLIEEPRPWQVQDKFYGVR